MIFAIVGEELGLVGAATVILAYCLIGYAGFRIALACRDPFGKRLAAALTALLCGQAALNLGAVLGFAPITGVPLPFVSYGGSSLVVSLAAIGILLNIALSDAEVRRVTVRDRGRGDGGHVLPALAVAEELTARGVDVTFAGPPRAERRILLDAGYEVDEFDVRGIPRDAGLATLKAVGVAAKAPAACAGILRRRRPHVVLGAGGYAAGPMVTAAWLLGIPAALTEADAELGLANRLAAPFAKRIFLAYPLPVGQEGSTGSSGGPCRGARWSQSRWTARDRDVGSGFRRRGPSCSSRAAARAPGG